MSDERILRDTVAIVTGGAGGIGREIARVFQVAGARVVVADINADGARRAATALGEGAWGQYVDITDEASVDSLFETVVALVGVPGILVNNAALTGSDPTCPTDVPILEVTVADWRRMIDINLTGAFICAQAAARLMAASGGGVIINVASIQGVVPTRGSIAYSVAKAGLVMMTKALAGELADFGIRVNAVGPGPIDLRALNGVKPAGAHAGTLLGRAGTPGDVARAILYLASNDGSFVDGELLMVDGGAAVRFREPPSL